MANKTIDLNRSGTSGTYIIGKIVCDATADYDLNNSDVTCRIYVHKDNDSTLLTVKTGGTWSYNMTINGKAFSGTVKKDVLLDWVLLATVSVSDIAHNDDGTKSISVSGWVTAPSTSVVAGHKTSGSGTFTLDTVPRASTITSAGDVTLGSVCNVKWTPASTSFRYKLKFSIGSWSHTTDVIHPNSKSPYTYDDCVIPLAAANQIPSKSGQMTVTLYTYSDAAGTKQVGSASSKTFTATVPDNEDTRPKVGMVLSPVSTLSAPFNSLYIQGKSKVKATLTPSAEFGASVVATSIAVSGTVYEAPYETGFLSQMGEHTIKATVKDSRGHYGTATEKITVIPYSSPKLQAASGERNIVAARCDANGNLSDSGTYLKIKVKLIYEKVMSDGVQNNHGKIQFRYRAEGAASYSDWQTVLDTRSTDSNEVITGALLSGTLLVQTNYQIQVRATDNLESANPVTLYAPSEKVYMDRPAGGKSMGLGGYSSGDGNLDVYWKTKARGGLSLYSETGEEMNLNEILPLPRGQLGEGWNPDSISDGVHVFQSAHPLKGPSGNLIMYNGALIQMPASVDGSVIIQIALSIDSGRNPVYRLKWYSNWSDWVSFKI